MHRSILWLHLYRLVRNSAIVAAMNCCSTSRALVHFFFDFCISILMQHFPFYTFGALLLCIPNQPISIERYALFGNSLDTTFYWLSSCTTSKYSHKGEVTTKSGSKWWSNERNFDRWDEMRVVFGPDFTGNEKSFIQKSRSKSTAVERKIDIERPAWWSLEISLPLLLESNGVIMNATITIDGFII